MKRSLGCAVVSVAVAMPFSFVALAPADAIGGLVVQDLNHGTSTAALVQSLLGSGVTASNVTYSGANVAAGTFSGGADSIGFATGIVMGSGQVQTVGTDSCSKGVEGPNECTGNTTDNLTPGDTNLTTLSGVSTFDASILEFDFIPQFSTISFQYVFSSDEYLEFANSAFNDTFAFFVNGTNCATVPGTTEPVSVNTINDSVHPSFYRDNTTSPFPFNTEMDGLTTLLTCGATVNPGVANHMKLAIADGSDSSLDSNVFLAGGSLVSGTQVTTSLSGGAQSGKNITVPPSTAVTDQATLTGAQAAGASGTMTYGVYSDSTCATAFASAGVKAVTGGVVPASDPVTIVVPGTYYWSAAYSGDPNNNATQVCDEIETVSEPATHDTATSYTGATTGTYSDPIVLGGHLVDTTASAPLAGKTLSLTVGTGASSQTTAAGPTNASGDASVTLAQLFQDAGSVPVTASFAGDGSFTASSGSSTIVVSPDDCTLAYTGDILVPALTNTTLKAQLTDPDPTQGDLSGHTVTFNVTDSATPPVTTQYTAVTNASGVASVSVALNADVYSVGVSFAGDLKYAACGTTSDTLVTITAAGNKVTGGGWATANGSGRFNFGFNLIPQTDGSYKGQLQTRSNSSKDNFHGRAVSSASQLAANKETWSGTGSYNGQPGATFTITVVDNGSGSKSTDTVSLVIQNAAGVTVFSTNGPVPLKGGNITIH